MVFEPKKHAEGIQKRFRKEMMAQLIKAKKNTQDYNELKNNGYYVFKAITEMMLETYEAKNKDYGNSASKLYDEFGMSAYVIRLTDKINRIKQLVTSGENNVETERLEDTLLDLANYSILALMDIQRSKGNEINAEGNNMD